MELSQIEEKDNFETFLRWVRTSANFFEVPRLIIEPKVSIIPSAWNNNISGTFLTAESFGKYLENLNLKWFQSMQYHLGFL